MSELTNVIFQLHQFFLHITLIFRQTVLSLLPFFLLLLILLQQSSQFLIFGRLRLGEFTHKGEHFLIRSDFL